MTNPGAVWVVIDDSTIVRAFDELAADGLPEFHPFPPADPATPSATAMSMAGSSVVRTHGINVIIDEQVPTAALGRIRASGAQRPDIDAFEASARKHLAIEPNANPNATIQEAVDSWAPDIVVTHAPDRYQASTLSPAPWVKAAIAATRYHQ